MCSSAVNFGFSIWSFYAYVFIVQIPHRCINHFVLDSGDTSEVPGTLANDVFKFVLKSYYLPTHKDLLKLVFSFYFSNLHSSTYFQNNVVFLVPITCFLKSVGVLVEL